MEQFLGWMKALRDKPGSWTGSIGLWVQTEEETRSFTLFLTEDGVELKEPGLRTADLVLSMKEKVFQAWQDGSLNPESLPTGDLAWDGDLKLFEELGRRMSHRPMKPHHSLFMLHNQDES